MSETKLVKPQLRNLHFAKLKVSLMTSLGIALGVALVFKIAIFDSHNRKVEEFYKHYDSAQALKKMNDSGFMESGPK